MESMTPDRWRLVREIFSELADLDDGARRAHLARARLPADLASDVEAILASHDALRGKRRFNAGALSALTAHRAFELSPGDTFADCTIIRELGAGGMGVVYLAEQHRPRRQVALKFIRADRLAPGILKRFEQESDILARLQHHAIAQVFEAGVAGAPDGRTQPFMLMEYVDGRPLTDAALRDATDTRARAALLAQICDGVHHAHQNQVVHRDLKPSNILVTRENRPKILDFGIARILRPDDADASLETLTGQIVGTLAYMSPEQLTCASRDQDIRVDVYALGVIGYELITGCPPYDIAAKPLSDVITVIRSGAAQVAAREAIRATDLGCVIQKALAPDRNERYASAAALADDLRRYVSGEAVTARPPSLAYQLRVLARRNTAAVVAAAVSAFALVVATVLSLAFAFNAERANIRARQEADKLTAVNTFFLDDIFGAADPETSRGREPLVLDAVNRAAGKVDAIDDPEVRAEVHHAISGLYQALAAPESGTSDASLLQRALTHAEKALALRLRVLEPPDRRLAESYVRIGRCASELGNHPTAVENLRRAAAMREQLDGAWSPDCIETKLWLATACFLAGDLATTESIAGGIVDALGDDPGRNPISLANAHVFLGDVADRHEDPDIAESHYASALRIAEGHLDAHPLMRAGMLEKLGLTIGRLRRDAAALALLEEATAIREAILPPGHHALAKNALSVVTIYMRAERYEDALRLARHAATSYERVFGTPNHDHVAHARVWCGKALSAMSRDAEAVDEYTQAVQGYQSAPSPYMAYIASALVYRGEAYLSLHECDAATADVDEARRIYDGLDDVAARRIEQLAQLQARLRVECGGPPP